MAIAFMIPFAKKFVPGFIGLLMLYVITNALRKRRIQHPNNLLPQLLLLAIFALHVVGLAWSEHIHEGLNETGIKLSYFAFPVIAWLMPAINKKQLQQIVMAFVHGCMAFILLAIGYGIYRSITLNDIVYLGYQELGIYLHPTYAATYMAMAYFLLMQNAARKDYFYNRRSLHYSVSLVLLVFISMLASKAGLLAALISILMAVIVFLQNKKTIAKTISITITSIVVLVVSTLIAPGTSMRVEAAMHDVESKHEQTSAIVEAKSSTQLRLVTWSAAWSILKENPFGVGTGDSESTLVTKYNEMEEPYAAEKLLNAHNQFLQSGIEHGWLGMILLLLLTSIVAYTSIRKMHWLMINFIILCAMNFLFESFLEVQAGIVFFCFWIAVAGKSGDD